MEKCATYIVGVVPLSWSAKAVVAMRGQETGAQRCGHGMGGFRNTHSSSFSKDNDRKRSSVNRILRPPMSSSSKAQHLYCHEKKTDDDDDTTCSTTSSSETEEDELSNSSFDEDNDVTSVYGDCRSKEEENEKDTSLLRFSKKSVSFATPLITDIHFRPRTLRQDKATLYYSDADYRFFRRDAYREAKAAAAKNDADNDESLQEDELEGRRVRFGSPQVVTAVWEYDYERDDALFWYSEAEIQDFLDEFVESLVLVAPSSSSSTPPRPPPQEVATVSVSA